MFNSLMVSALILFLINLLWAPILLLGSYLADFWEYMFDKTDFRDIIWSK